MIPAWLLPMLLAQDGRDQGSPSTLAPAEFYFIATEPGRYFGADNPDRSFIASDSE